MNLRALAPFALGCGVVAASLLAFLAAPSPPPGRSKPVLGALHMAIAAHAAEPPAAEPAPQPAVVRAPPSEPADKHLVRSWRAPLAGGLLTFPPSFHSEDGRYDLVLHLNGNTDLVEESYGYAGVNAVVVILNLGVGSGVYEDRFEDPAAFSLILERAQTTMIERGLKNAHLGRVAVSGWSSGYGGVIKLLGHPAVFDKIDAVVLFDSIHCGYDPYTKKLKADQIEHTRRFAKKAVEGKALLSITHSEIVTYGYLNAHDATDKVLEAVGLKRSPSTTWQPMPKLATMVGVLPKAQMVPLPPLTEVHKNGLHVRGYSGHMPVTHMLHLVQMSTTALPDLVEHWKRPAAP
jgi:hypothetical protein